MPFEQLFSWPDHTLLFQALPVTLTKENKSFLTQHFDQVQSGYSCYSNFFGGVEKINIVSEKKKKQHIIKKAPARPSQGPALVSRCSPSQPGLMKAPYVSNPSASGVIQIAPKQDEACQATQASERG